MADVSFTNLTNLPPEIATNLEAINRKKRIQDALMAQTLQQHKTQMTGGKYSRAVEYSPWEGATKLIQAAMLNKMSDRSNEDLNQLGADYRGQGDEVVRNMQAQATGGVPWRKPDPMGAVTTGAGSVYPQAQRVSDAMLKAQQIQSGKQRGGYYTPIYGEDGRVWKWNNRTGDYEPTEIVAGKLDPRTQENIARGKGRGDVRGKDMGQAQIDLPKAEETAAETTRLTDKLRTHPGMKDVIGFPDNPLVMKGKIIPGTDAADFRVLLDQLTSRTFMEIFPTLKGGGQITEVEGEKGQQSVNRMNSATSEKAFLEALDDFDAEVVRLKNIVSKRAGVPVKSDLPPSPKGNTRIRFDAQGNMIQ